MHPRNALVGRPNGLEVSRIISTSVSGNGMHDKLLQNGFGWVGVTVTEGGNKSGLFKVMK